MKIVYIGSHLPHRLSWTPFSNPLLLRQLPAYAAYVECYCVEDAKAQLADADVVFLENIRGLPFWQEIKTEIEAVPLVCASYCDVWRQPWWFKYLRTDVNVVMTKAAALAALPVTEHSKVYCAGYRTDAVDYNVERDIDIILWGDWHHLAYPFRMFIQQQHVNKWIEGQTPVTTTGFPRGLNIYEVELGGKKYKLGYVSRKFDYFGPALHQLLSRCKIACTGPGWKKGIRIGTGKYYENPACGTVVVSAIFDEMEELGFEHGKNVWLTDEEKFVTDLIYLLETPELVQQISKNGKELMQSRYTAVAQAAEFYKFLQEKTGKL